MTTDTTVTEVTDLQARAEAGLPGEVVTEARVRDVELPEGAGDRKSVV